MFLGDLDVNAELVKLGHAWAFRHYMRKVEDANLCQLEDEARTAKRGLWGLPKNQRVAPWEWRRRKNLVRFTEFSNETAQSCIATIGG